MLRLAEKYEVINVVDDQTGRPTYAPHLCYVISKLIETDNYGTYHISNNGYCSWFEFAKTIFEYCEIDIKVNPISSEEFNAAAIRPAYSVMDISKIENILHYKLPHWKEGLRAYLDER